MKSIFACQNPETVEMVYAPETILALKEEAGLEDGVFTADDLRNNPEKFADVDFIFSTWGMLCLSEEEIGRILPKLQCVFYGAGTVQEFARPFLHCGVKVFSAWAANAVPVAEYATAQMILANKGYFRTAPLMSAGRYTQARQVLSGFPGNFGESVGVIGAGMIGKLVIRMLKNYHLRVKTFDPFLPDEKAEELGVEKVSLPELFSTCQVVSNHLANNAQTRGMLTYELFASMLPNATFLNTGRGAQVVEADLARVLEEREDLTAILDVTFPEPPEEGHPFYRLPNCILTPHIAGSSGREVHRMAEYMLEEFRLYRDQRPVRYEVTEKMLLTMA